MVEVPAEVARICTRYLRVADREAPGLVEGLYLHGSVALGDYRRGRSDIDFVAVTAWPAHIDDLRAIHRALRRRARRPFFDGIYLGRHALRRDPRRLPAGPAVHEWRVNGSSRFERSLVTWHLLAQAGVTVRGPAVAELGIHTDWPGLAEATRRNLDEYWAPWLDRRARGPVGLSSWAATWGVLGVARLRHTLAAGRITSKTDAAGYALATYDPRWHRIIEEALRIRVGGAPRYRNPCRRRTDLIGFVAEALRG